MNRNWLLENKKVTNPKTCEWYLYGFCCRDLDAGRAWNCPPKYAKNKKDFLCKYYEKQEKKDE